MSAWPEAVWLKNQLETSINNLQNYEELQQQVNNMTTLINNSLKSSSTYMAISKEALSTNIQPGSLGFIYKTI